MDNLGGAGGDKNHSDMVLPCDSENYNWREQFKNPIVQRSIKQRSIKKEDKPMDVIKKEQVAADIDQIMLDFDSAVKDAERVLVLAQKHREAAAACAKSLGADKCEKVVEMIWN